MGKYYIYNANSNEIIYNKATEKKFKDATVIFNPSTDLDFNALKKEITEHFRDYHQTSAIIFIHCRLKTNYKDDIEQNLDKIFKGIPTVEEVSLSNNILYASFDVNKIKVNSSDEFLRKNIDDIINQGLTNIFISNGGLVESSGISHHYVFPSGKHSSKFLRTANVLVKKSEIDFIALNTLHKFNSINIKNIYCDTLSINVVAYSINQFLKRYNEKHIDVNIESFKSYDGLYDKDTKFLNDSVFLISASTSGGLVEYIKKNHGQAVNSNNICVLYYLPIDKDSDLAKERVLCNLEINNNIKSGLELYPQFKPTEPCDFCKNKSIAIKILGDSFSLDEPIINTRNIIANKYISNKLKDFVELFKYNPHTGTSLKTSYIEVSNLRKKYDIYIDYEKIISNIDLEIDLNGKKRTIYEKHKLKLDSYINQYIPASIKYIIHLNDKGSELLAEYIKNKVSGFTKSSIKIINQSNLTEGEILSDEIGSILIVASCITNGKNLLYLSRFFRNHANVRLVYFVAINRISDESKQKELKSNIKYGLYGPENSSFIEIESINCDNSNFQTPWERELEHLKELREKIKDNFIEDRISTIENFDDIKIKGGSDKIFNSDLNNEELKIRKNSAFFNDNSYYNNISQSDIYFTISCVLNNMRNNKVDGLYQTNFVRNLIDPFIFNRFNDGIIQSAILRSAKDEELNYSYSLATSTDMYTLLKTIIKHKNEYQGEAILEFLFALSIGKLKLHKSHYSILIDDLKEIDNEKIKLFIEPIQNIYKNCI
ncbi:hypothetical protein [Flavobacterium bizetiae]|uniref:hypothetical protein n=3 Tax=Flavobacterium bizetiae TaxID=2704140 RepID=UPI00174B5121|nr:hypothetical protein [Flavobacterium bizetiae]CAD5343599.1 hypothetical protein FLA105535_03599 [Flavobacterium bizetiae]CAD5347792.1 hypothetical protein FLA105534_01751 [Flavobacterium bizetiae]